MIRWEPFMLTDGDEQAGPRTEALRRVLRTVRDETMAADLQFLEDWWAQRRPGIADYLRASQIRRANPTLAEEIRAELGRR
jgi:hypothetical protein